MAVRTPNYVVQPMNMRHARIRRLKTALVAVRAALLLAPLVVVAPLNAAGLKQVAFYQDIVLDLNGKVVKFMMGSTWILEREIVAVPLGEGILICDGPAPEYSKDRFDDYLKALPKACVLNYSDNTVNAARIEGVFLLKDGLLGNVVESLGGGAVLKTDDGSLWSIPEYDRYHTGWWLPPYPVLIFGAEQYMINLKKGKKVWIEKRLK